MKSLAEFVALARAKPDTLNVAAAAGNSELIMSSFIKTQNLPVTKVPYRDILQAPNDLSQGRIQALLTSYATMLGLIQSGKIKILAVTSQQARRNRAGRSDGDGGGLSIPRHGQPDRHLRPARDDECAARENRRGRPGGHGRRPHHRAAAGATAQVVDVRGPAEFAAGIKEMRDQLAEIAKGLGIKAAQQAQ